MDVIDAFRYVRFRKINLENIGSLSSRAFTCGFCGSPVASEKGWYADVSRRSGHAYIYVCHQCTCPTFFDVDGTQTPGVAFGQTVSDVSDISVSSLYDEARKATSAGAFTASVLACRKLLMHITVAKGAKSGESFVTYVEYLASNNYVPPDARDWIEHIRKKGNEANHEINIATREDAEELLGFMEMLLKLIYEFPARVKRKYPPTQP